jgi:hypothetical protein
VSDAAATRCERVRERAALAPDGELAVLERRLLDAHLSHCEQCRVFARRFEAVVEELRTAATARPARATQLPRSRPVRPLLRAAAVAGVAAMAVGIGVRGPLPAAERAASAAAADPVAEMHALRELRRDALVASAVAAEERPRRFGDLPA